MIPDDKLAKIVSDILDKTIARKIPWEENDGPFGAFYSFPLPNAEVKVSYVTPVAEPDNISIEFNRKDGRTVGQVKAFEDDELWPIAKRLYDEIDRIVSRWDEVLEDVQKYLAKK